MPENAALVLGQLPLASRWILAPLESVTDSAFRRLCWQQGAALTFTEMIRARALARRNRSTLELVDTVDADVPTGVQLLVTSEGELEDALGALAKARTHAPHLANVRVVDLNFGCPSPDVIRVGAGPALLKRRAKLRAIFEALRRAQRAGPLRLDAIGAKIRLGLNRAEQDQKVYLPIVELANEHLDYLTVHARHARQGSDDPPTWAAIREVKARATIPIIGNGGALDAESAQRLVAETGCDGVLIARGAIRSPWLFRALCDRGAAGPTAPELEAARRGYFDAAVARGTKPKFLEWHTEGFERMARRLRGAPGPRDGAWPTSNNG